MEQQNRNTRLEILKIERCLKVKPLKKYIDCLKKQKQFTLTAKTKTSGLLSAVENENMKLHLTKKYGHFVKLVSY